MNEDFVSFSLAKKLKEKGFDCNEPFAMYNELGIFHPLYTSCDETLENCIFGNRGYYDYDDFDENDYACPTISQVLKWLREEKKIHIGIVLTPMDLYKPLIGICKSFGDNINSISPRCFPEEAAIAGIEYVLDNLI